MRMPDNGLTMNIAAEAGLRSALTISISPAWFEILRSARASAIGSPLIAAPSRSAEYSRVRLIAICTRPAAIGAKITASSSPIAPKAP